MMKRILLAILAIATANAAFAQAVAVRGRVVSDTGEPLRNASVSQGLTAVRTDGEGRFVINVTQPGGSLTVVKAGFVRQTFPASGGDVLVTMARGGLLAVSVIDASGSPAPRAAITVTCTRASWSGMPTDDRGQRRFGGLAPGRCDVSTGAPAPPPPPTGPPSLEDLNGRMDAARARSEQQRTEHLAGAIAVEIRAGEEASVVLVGTPSTAPMPLRGNSTISGTIVDEFGDPAEEAVVQVQPVIPGSPPPSAQPRRTGAGTLTLTGMIATTDDRGQYRASGLPPGSYRITAGWSRENPALVFYPGRRDEAEATLVTVVADTETANIDFRLAPGLGGTVMGQVLTSAGQRPAGAIAQLVSPATKDSAPQQVALVHANQEGRFTFSGVAPGIYDLQVSAGAGYVFAQRSNTATAPAVIPPMEFGSTRVTVSDGSPTTVSLSTVPGASLRGRIEIEGDRGTLRFQDIRVLAAGDSSRTAEIAGDGTFELRNLYGETRLAAFAGASGWWLKSFMVGGVNGADDPVAFLNATDSRADARVVLARAAIVSGTVTSAGAAARVVAFPVDPDRGYSSSRYVRTASVGRDGRFTLEVPPGQYWVVALEGVPLVTEALMMRLQSMSTQVTASDTRAAQVDLSMVRPPQ